MVTFVSEAKREKYLKDAEDVISMSDKFTPRQIAEKLGIRYDRVLFIQNDPEFGMTNPKRESGKRKFVPKEKDKPGFFNHKDYK